jgi:uncharacterized protein
MRRRLRKKKHLGEFQELGFAVRAEFRADLSGDHFQAFFERLVHAIDARDLAVGGGGSEEKFEAFVTQGVRGNPTEEDRAALGAFLGGDTAIARHAVGPLLDAWYGLPS